MRSLAVSLCCQLVLLAVRGETAPRFVLVENFGEPGCADCTHAREALQVAERRFEDDEVIWLDHHVADHFANAHTAARHAYYGGGTVPQVWFDGGTSLGAGGDPAGDYEAAIVARLGQPSPIVIESTYLFEDVPGRVDIDVVVDPGETIASPEECFVRAIVYEDEIVWCCGEDGNDRWDRIVRALLPDVPLTAVNGGEKQAVEHVVPIDPAWNVDRLRVIAFVQRDPSGEILQADPSIDAGALNPLPEVPPELVRVQLDQSFPNPAPGGNARISWVLDGRAHVLLRILDANGRVVRVLNDGERPEGRSFVDWNGADFRGQRMAAGVYVIELVTPGDRTSRKMVLLR